MRIKRRILLFHISFFVVLSTGFLWPQFYYYSFIFFCFLFLFFVFKSKRISDGKGGLFLFILPAIFLIALFFYSSLLTNRFFLFSFLFLGIFFSFYYFKELKQGFIQESSFRKRRLFIWNDLLALLTVFLGVSFTYALNYFININNLILLVVIVLILFFSIWQNLLVSSLDKRKVLLFISLFLLAISPLAWILFSLPFNYNFLGLLLLLCYYGGLRFMKFYFLGSLDNKKIKYNLILILSFLVFIFLMVKWH